MNQTIPLVRFRPSVSQHAIVIFVVLLTLLANTIHASESKTYEVETVEEFINAVKDINSKPETRAQIILNGTFKFIESYENNESPLPALKAKSVVVRALPGTQIIWEPEQGQSPIETVFLQLDNEFYEPADMGLVIGAAFLWVPIPFDIQLKHGDPIDVNNLQATPKAEGDSAIFQGFDYIVKSTNATVVLNNISAECGEQCISSENSRIIVTDSNFKCDEDCIRATSVVANTVPFDFDTRREGLLASDLSPDDKATFLAQLDQSEQLLNNYDVAVVNSDLRSQRTPVTILGHFNTPDPARTLVDRSLLRTNSSASWAVQIKNPGDNNYVFDSVLSGPTSRRELLDSTYGTVTARNLFIDRGTRAIYVTDGSVNLSSSAISPQRRSQEDIADACSLTFRSDAVHSGGYNIVSDDTCRLDGSGDLENTDPGLFLPDDGSLIPEFAPDSPAIDGGSAVVIDDQLPCSTTDITGLPRPQDGNNDGAAECDVGPVELQAGEDIAAPQSGSFYDTSRDGEGVFVEMLGNGLAVVYLFSYTPDGSRAFWAAGVGDVVGNGIVFRKDSFLTSKGGVFGDSFDPDAVQFIPFADMSISFPDCSNTVKQGTLSIEPNEDLGFSALLSRTTRLTTILSCDSLSASGPGYSGSFYDPLHDGEGIIVQVISDSLAVIMWFTYDNLGNQQWITGVGTITDTTITVTDAYTQTGPGYGPEYDSNGKVRTTWGDFSVNFGPECNSAILSYASVIVEYGSGSQNLQRLTNLDGLECGL